MGGQWTDSGGEKWDLFHLKDGMQKRSIIKEGVADAPMASHAAENLQTRLYRANSAAGLENGNKTSVILLLLLSQQQPPLLLATTASTSGLITEEITHKQ